MFEDEELERLARDLESDRVERKESFSSSARERVKQAVCAFANDLPGHGRPGVIFVGLRDDGSHAGLAVTDELLLNLAAIRSDGNILPLPSLVVEKRRLAGGDVAVVFVHPCGEPPVLYDGRIWIRVGPRRAIASRDEERRLAERRIAGDVAFDRRPVPGTGTDELDIPFFDRVYLPRAVATDVLAANDRTTDERLRALHLVAREGEPTYGALLLLGIDPRRCLAGAYTQFIRIQGTDLSDPILDQKELGGPIPQQLREAEGLVRLNVRVGLALDGGPVDERRPDYPGEALQQTIANALLHRTYESNSPVRVHWFSNRVEVFSPGGLYGRVTPENFGLPYATDYRNPTLAEGLKVLGHVQRFGMGIALTRRLCRENGNPEPRYDFSSGNMLVTLEPAT